MKGKKKPSKKLLKKQHVRHVFTAIAGLMLLGVIGLGLVAAFFTSNAGTPKRLVTFYDRGEKHVIITRGDTVRAALAAAHITVDLHDEVDPSVGSKLTSPYTDVIIYRSRLVAITDGGIHLTVLTTAQSPNEIVKAARLPLLSAKDQTKFSQGQGVSSDGASVELTVKRAEPLPEPKKQPKIVFGPTPQALTPSKGAQVFVDSDGVAHRETYYDLPMNVVIGACGSGGYTIRSDGAKIDSGGYVLVAANYGAYPRCTVVQTSLGPGKVYDTGGFAARYPYGFDLATDWTNHDGR